MVELQPSKLITWVRDVYKRQLLSQGEVPVASAIGLIMQFPINIAFGISVVLFFTAAFILISGLKSQNS